MAVQINWLKEVESLLANQHTFAFLLSTQNVEHEVFESQNACQNNSRKQ